jgi:hypothetical protein
MPLTALKSFSGEGMKPETTDFFLYPQTSSSSIRIRIVSEIAFIPSPATQINGLGRSDASPNLHLPFTALHGLIRKQDFGPQRCSHENLPHAPC